MPPIEGVIFLWIFLRPGMSPKFFLKENLIITGTMRKDITNDVIAAASSMAIMIAKVGKNNEMPGILNAVMAFCTCAKHLQRCRFLRLVIREINEEHLNITAI